MLGRLDALGNDLTFLLLTLLLVIVKSRYLLLPPFLYILLILILILLSLPLELASLHLLPWLNVNFIFSSALLLPTF